MNGSPALTSRRSVAILASWVLLSFPGILASPGMAAESPTLDRCESALEHLITVLESKHQLAGPHTLYKGGPLGETYSKCRIGRHGSSWPRYSVYRSRDDVTVVIEKKPGDTAEPLLYGPFKSAYRK